MKFSLKDFINAHQPKELISYQDYEAKLEKVRADAKAKGEKKKENSQNPDEMAPPGVEDGDSSMPPVFDDIYTCRCHTDAPILSSP